MNQEEDDEKRDSRVQGNIFDKIKLKTVNRWKAFTKDDKSKQISGEDLPNFDEQEEAATNDKEEDDGRDEVDGEENGDDRPKVNYLAYGRKHNK